MNETAQLDDRRYYARVRSLAVVGEYGDRFSGTHDDCLDAKGCSSTPDAFQRMGGSVAIVVEWLHYLDRRALDALQRRKESLRSTQPWLESRPPEVRRQTRHEPTHYPRLEM